MKIDVSIIIVNYNTGSYLFNCISSILLSKFDRDIEIIIVDNNSIDDSIEKINEIRHKIKVIKNKHNYGFSKGINIGLKQAIGRYVCIINPDSKLDLNCLHTLYRYMEKNKNISCVTPKILNDNNTLQISCKRSFPTISNSMFKLLGIDKVFSNVSILSKYNLLYLDENRIHQVEVISGAFMFMRKEVFDHVGWFDESFFLYGEDIDYCRRMYKKNKKIIYLPTATVIHYKGKSAYSHPIRVIYEFHQSMIKYYLKYQHDYMFWRINKIFIIVIINIKKYLSYLFHFTRKVLK